MAIRISDYYMGLSVAWVFLLLLQFQLVAARHLLPLYALVGLMVSGASLGVAVASVHASQRLASLEKTGEARTSWSTVLIIFGGVIVFSAVWLMVASRLHSEVLMGAVGFLAAVTPAVYAMEAYLFRNWERKNKKRILQGLWSSRLYVCP